MGNRIDEAKLTGYEITCNQASFKLPTPSHVNPEARQEKDVQEQKIFSAI